MRLCHIYARGQCHDLLLKGEGTGCHMALSLHGDRLQGTQYRSQLQEAGSPHSWGQGGYKRNEGKKKG